MNDSFAALRLASSRTILGKRLQRAAKLLSESERAKLYVPYIRVPTTSVQIKRTS